VALRGVIRFRGSSDALELARAEAMLYEAGELRFFGRPPSLPFRRDALAFRSDFLEPASAERHARHSSGRPWIGQLVVAGGMGSLLMVSSLRPWR